MLMAEKYSDEKSLAGFETCGDVQLSTPRGRRRAGPPFPIPMTPAMITVAQ